MALTTLVSRSGGRSKAFGFKSSHSNSSGSADSSVNLLTGRVDLLNKNNLMHYSDLLCELKNQIKVDTINYNCALPTASCLTYVVLNGENFKGTPVLKHCINKVHTRFKVSYLVLNQRLMYSEFSLAIFPLKCSLQFRIEIPLYNPQITGFSIQ